MRDEELKNVLERFLVGLPAAAAEKARTFRPLAEVPLDELGTHPDLGERLLEIGKPLPGVEAGIFYKFFALRLRAGPIFALARGTHTLSFRVGRNQSHVGQPDTALGPEWITLDPWNVNMPTAQWLAELTRVARLAHTFASEIAVSE
jgi:hypothetical protein